MANENEEVVWQSFLLAPRDPGMSADNPREALTFAEAFLEAVHQFGWSNSEALHKLSLTGFAQVNFGIFGDGTYDPPDFTVWSAVDFSHRVKHFDYFLDPENNRDPYTQLWWAVQAVLRMNIIRGNSHNEWAVRYHLQPNELGDWINTCRDAYVESLEVALLDDDDDQPARELGMWILENRNYDLNLTYSILRLQPLLFFPAAPQDNNARGEEDNDAGEGMEAEN